MSSTVNVTVIPECDIHKYDQGIPGIPAVIDGKTTRGPWANMCESCFSWNGIGLGTGLGQRFVLAAKSDDKPESKPAKSIYEMDADELEDFIGDGDICDYI